MMTLHDDPALKFYIINIALIFDFECYFIIFCSHMQLHARNVSHVHASQCIAELLS